MSEMSLDEILATLKNSDAPTIIIEGRDDYLALEEFERENVEWGLTVLPVSGRSTVISLFKRRHEIENPAIFFVMDQDEWCFTGVPDDLSCCEVALTDGASIENDLIDDGKTWEIMSLSERKRFFDCVSLFFSIFRRLVFNHVNSINDFSYATSARIFFDDDLNPKNSVAEFLARCESAFAAPDGCNEMKMIRGKTLLEIAVMVLSHKSRTSKYSRANILEMGARRRGPNIRRIESLALTFFSAKGSLIEAAPAAQA